MPEWLIAILGALLTGGGIAGIIQAVNGKRTSDASASKTAIEAEAQGIMNAYAPGEKMVTLAERAAELVTTRYEKVMERQDQTIEQQNLKISELKKEVMELRLVVEESKQWHVMLQQRERELVALKTYIVSSGLEMPDLEELVGQIERSEAEGVRSRDS